MSETRDYAAQAKERGIPDYMIESLVQYVLRGRPVGGFLSAVLSNDLMGAFSTADAANTRAIKAYTMFLWNDAPAGCFGSEAHVDRWEQRGGLLGTAADEEVGS